MKKEVILVGIIREKLFGKDTIEEAMKVVDNVSCQLTPGTSMKVLLGINDQEYNLIKKSLRSRNSLKGKFMSPVIALCDQNQIESDWIGRNLAATSSRLSRISLYYPLQLGRLCFILVSKSWALIRTPQARPFLQSKIPDYVEGYINENAECMALKIQDELCRSSTNKLVAVVPFENYPLILEALEGVPVSNINSLDVGERIEELDSPGISHWLIVIGLYLVIPAVLIFESLTRMNSSKLKDLSNYETQGIALGTWVRDKRRD